jgi:RNA polymerase sigma-70 factor, ECF subfamily
MRGSATLCSVDERAAELETLYREGFTRIRRGVMTVVGSWDEAGDVVQEAFAQAWRRREGFRADGTLEAWVWKIALRIAGRRVSQARRRDEIAEGIAPVLPQAERIPELAEAFAELPPRRRLLVVLRYVGGLSYAEIADVTGITEGSVAGALSKARRQLVRSLEQKGVAP